jgi:hypothetical protein
MRRFSGVSFIAVVICAVALAACGSSKSNSSSSSTPSSAATPATASTAAPATTTSSSSSSGSSAAAAANPEVQSAVAACKSSVGSAPTLNSTEKGQLDNLCSQAGSGNVTQVKKVAQQVCTEIVKDSVPAAEQSTALSACKSAAG